MKNKRLVVLNLLGLFCLAGCSHSSTEKQSSNVPSSPISMDAPPPPTVDVHEHPSEGPHHGSLIELGKEEYHAELVHDEKSVTIYVLDGAAKGPVPIEATEVAINLIHDGKPEQFKLAASPDTGDPNGKASRFVSSDAKLASHMDEESSSPKLSLSINGKNYRGVISHDHSGHDHGH